MNQSRYQRYCHWLFSYSMIWLLAGCGWFGSKEPPPAPAPPVTGPPALMQNDDQYVLPYRLELPAIELDTPVVELGWRPTENQDGQIFSEWDVAEYAAGWHINSALPGQQGNMVLSAHNNILGAVFRELDQLKKGDEAVIWAGKQRHVYRIDKVMIVPEKQATPEQQAENAQWITPFDDDRLTLVSCWPRDDNTHRIIVVAQKTETEMIESAQLTQQ